MNLLRLQCAMIRSSVTFYAFGNAENSYVCQELLIYFWLNILFQCTSDNTGCILVCCAILWLWSWIFGKLNDFTSRWRLDKVFSKHRHLSVYCLNQIRRCDTILDKMEWIFLFDNQILIFILFLTMRFIVYTEKLWLLSKNLNDLCRISVAWLKCRKIVSFMYNVYFSVLLMSTRSGEYFVCGKKTGDLNEIWME